MALPGIISVLAPTAAETAVEIFGKKVLSRWSDYRARRFVEQFVLAATTVDAATDTAKLEQQLTQIIDDQNKSAALYDAFRHVFTSASRETGPRVMGLHMAEVIAGKVNDAEVSDMIMLAAASLLDFEFEGFLSYAAEAEIPELSFAASLDHTVIYNVDTVDVDSNFRRRRSATGPLALRNQFGSWAQKLSNVGLLVQDISEETFGYDVDPEQRIDEPGTLRRIYRNLEFREGTGHLLRLVRVVTGARQSV
jgi:hypothetical protein